MNQAASVNEVLERRCCVQGYHMYKDVVWEAAVGEVLICEQEPDSASDTYAMAGKKGTIVGHLPRKLTRVCLRLLFVVENVCWFNYSL